MPARWRTSASKTRSLPAGSHSATQGVQNGNASSAAFLDGRAGSDFVLNNDAVRFTTAAEAAASLG